MNLKNYGLKVTLIVPNFILIAFSTVIGLALYRYLFCIYFEIFTIREVSWEFYIPIFFPAISLLIGLQKRLSVLVFKKDKRERGHALLWLITLFTISIMGIMSQKYLTTITNKKITATNLGDIETQRARYYTVSDYYVDANKVTYYSTLTKSGGRSDKHFNLEIYFVYPVLDKKGLQVTLNYKYWYGIHYHNRLNINISDAEKKIQYKLFIANSIELSKDYNFYNHEYLERVPSSLNKYNYIKAIAKQIKRPSYKNTIVLTDVYKLNLPDDKTSSTYIKNVLFIFVIGLMLLLLVLLFPVISTVKYKKFLEYQKRTWLENIKILMASTD